MLACIVTILPAEGSKGKAHKLKLALILRHHWPVVVIRAVYWFLVMRVQNESNKKVKTVQELKAEH